MKKVVLIDGNNLMFRSYYATAYNGNLMKNSKDFPTNALYGFASMINKIVAEEKPKYIMVAFDIGKNFRKQEYDFYKEGRSQTPEELKAQMPIARKLLDAMGIKYFEMEPYEADDIIGTFVKMISNDPEYDATIVSSDKDLLQLINFETDIKLLKQTGYIRYDEKSFFEEYHIKPINVIDLKALMGDASDNIPGVKGIGEKTALKLLSEYQTIENIYNNIDNIKGSVHEKLVNDKENAFMSKKIATIYCDVPLNANLDSLTYDGPNEAKLRELYTELEFYSLLKKLGNVKKDNEVKYINVSENINIVLENKISLFVDVSDEVYTSAEIIGASICDSKYTYYFDKNNLYRLKDALNNKHVITYNNKKNLHFLDNNYVLEDDLMVLAYLLGYNNKEDITTLSNALGYDFLDTTTLIKNKDNNKYINETVLKCRFIYDNCHTLIEKASSEEILDLYHNIELPLIPILSNMEKYGIKVDKDVLISQGKDIEKRIEELTDKIYILAGEEFNIASVKQLGEILFDKLQIAKGKKNKTGYKTDVSTLEKLVNEHPIINLILEYRNLAKLKSTYIEGLLNYVDNNNLIHTIFKQTVARTGRLSSTEPNLQNIPVREELGRNIRKAFIPQNDLFLSCDYSQIELRVLAHLTNCKTMIDTFINDGDIHTKVASDINNVPCEQVTKDMRSKAKSVIFGIVYGISGYGLMDNLHISKKEADFFISKYYDLYPEVRIYMDQEIKFAHEKGYVTTMFNRKRYIDEINNHNFMIRQSGERMAINTPVQGAAADIIKKAMISVNKALEDNKLESKMILQIHDELIFDAKKSEIDKLKEIVKDCMENIIDLAVPLKVSCDTGDNWFDTK